LLQLTGQPEDDFSPEIQDMRDAKYEGYAGYAKCLNLDKKYIPYDFIRLYITGSKQLKWVDKVINAPAGTDFSWIAVAAEAASKLSKYEICTMRMYTSVNYDRIQIYLKSKKLVIPEFEPDRLLRFSIMEDILNRHKQNYKLLFETKFNTHPFYDPSPNVTERKFPDPEDTEQMLRMLQWLSDAPSVSVAQYGPPLMIKRGWDASPPRRDKRHSPIDKGATLVNSPTRPLVESDSLEYRLVGVADLYKYIQDGLSHLSQFDSYGQMHAPGIMRIILKAANDQNIKLGQSVAINQLKDNVHDALVQLNSSMSENNKVVPLLPFMEKYFRDLFKSDSWTNFKTQGEPDHEISVLAGSGRFQEQRGQRDGGHRRVGQGRRDPDQRPQINDAERIHQQYLIYKNIEDVKNNISFSPSMPPTPPLSISDPTPHPPHSTTPIEAVWLAHALAELKRASDPAGSSPSNNSSSSSSSSIPEYFLEKLVPYMNKRFWNLCAIESAKHHPGIVLYVQMRKLFGASSSVGELLLPNTPIDVIRSASNLSRLSNFMKILKYVKKTTWKLSLEMFISELDNIFKKMPLTTTEFQTYHGSGSSESQKTQKTQKTHETQITTLTKKHKSTKGVDLYISSTLNKNVAALFGPCIITYVISPGSLALPLFCISGYSDELEILLPHQPKQRNTVKEYCDQEGLPIADSDHSTDHFLTRLTKFDPKNEYKKMGTSNGSNSAQESNSSSLRVPRVRIQSLKRYSPRPSSERAARKILTKKGIVKPVDDENFAAQLEYEAQLERLSSLTGKRGEGEAHENFWLTNVFSLRESALQQKKTSQRLRR
jgi:hypothetical protein